MHPYPPGSAGRSRGSHPDHPGAKFKSGSARDAPTHVAFGERQPGQAAHGSKAILKKGPRFHAQCQPKGKPMLSEAHRPPAPGHYLTTRSITWGTELATKPHHQPTQRAPCGHGRAHTPDFQALELQLCWPTAQIAHCEPQLPDLCLLHIWRTDARTPETRSPCSPGAACCSHPGASLFLLKG